jgi:hypothetical protein
LHRHAGVRRSARQREGAAGNGERVRWPHDEIGGPGGGGGTSCACC